MAKAFSSFCGLTIVFPGSGAERHQVVDDAVAQVGLGHHGLQIQKVIPCENGPDLILGKGPLMFTESSIGTVQSYQELGIPVYTELASASIDQSLDNIVKDVRNIGEIFNVQETANAYADELQERIDALMDKVSSQSGEPLKVLFMAGYADGTFVAFNSKMSSCMLNALNAENVLDKGGNGLTLENLVSMNPDIIVYVRADRFGSTDADAVEQLTSNAAGMENANVTQEMEEERQTKHKIKVVPPEALEKAHTYVELNFGKTYLNEMEEKRMNQLMCRDIHGDCSLYFTEGILKNPVRRNYQYEYAKRLKNKNIWLYHDKHRIVKRNIALLTEMLKKSLVIKSESQEILSDRGTIVPSRLWRLGRSGDAKVFMRELKGDSSDFVVDVLIDASGSQMSRQGEVALQAYIISESLSNAGLPHRVMSYCTFWDYTILHRFREYDDPRSANENIFNYVTSSNNRDGLAIRAAGYGLLMREEEKKILIILSDGRPYDVVVNRPNARNPQPYHGKYAITDTAAQIRKLRSQGVSVLGVFAGEEKDLATEKKIFGKDFAYIRNITGFSKIVGRYLTKQLEDDE